jgi:hypothetical protein
MKTLLQKLYPKTLFTDQNINRIEYQYKDSYNRYSIHWINDWAGKVINNICTTDWDGEEALEFALKLEHGGYEMNLAKHFTSICNSIYNTTSFIINTEDYKIHISDNLNEYGIQLGLEPKFVTLVIIWVWG